jgi:hypothetical protein
MSRVRLRVVAGVLGLAVAIPLLLAATPWGSVLANLIASRVNGPFTIDDRLAQFGPAARERLRPGFTSAGLPYPPPHLLFLGLKEEKRLEIYARTSETPWKRVATYPVLAASGGPGPKQREGDRQVPEGFYRIELLNPNSRFHVSLRLNYPNEEDRARATPDDQPRLGGDIMIHGNAVSVGCLAMGDRAAEDLFTLAADTGPDRIEVILCPADFRRHPGYTPPPGSSPAVAALYTRLRHAIAPLDPR